MSSNILLAQINTEIERIENLIEIGHPDDVRRARLNAHSERLQNLKKQVQSETDGLEEIREEFAKLKNSAQII